MIISIERYEDILDKLEINGMYIEKLPAGEKNEIINDKIAMQIAAQSNPYSFQFASKKLRSNSAYMFENIQMDPFLSCYCDASLLANDKFFIKVKNHLKSHFIKTIEGNSYKYTDEQKYMKEMTEIAKATIKALENSHEKAKKAVAFRKETLEGIQNL